MNFYFVVGIIFLYCIPTFSQTLKEKAESGDKIAQYQYAKSLTNRYPKEDDYQKEVIWLRKSAEQRNETAQYNIGVCYTNGHGVATF